MENPLREHLALALAQAMRNPLEEFHAGTRWKKSGLTDPVMAFVNRRAAHYCYVNLAALEAVVFSRTMDFAPWVSGMWKFAVLDTDLRGFIVIHKTPLTRAHKRAEKAIRLIRVVLEYSLQNDQPFHQCASAFPCMMPSGWDSPSIPVSACSGLADITLVSGVKMYRE